MKAGWEIKKLGEVCDFEGGSQPPKSNFIYEPKEGYTRFLQIRDFGTEKHATYIPNSSKNRLCNADDILIGRYGASVGKILTGKAGAYNVALMKTEPDSRLLHKGWFYNYLISSDFQQSLMKVADRSAQNGFSKDDIYNFPVPIPPLSEQAHIVGILDEAFASIATAKANTQKNLENATAVFESHLNSVFSKRGEGWVEKKLGEVCENISTGPFGTMLHKSDYVPNGIPLVNPMNINGSKIEPSERMMVSKETRDRLAAYTLKHGDVVIARRGELGRCAVVTEAEDGWLCGTGSFFIRLHSAIDPTFFVAQFSSEKTRQQLESESVGTTMNSLNHGILENLPLIFPSKSVQQKIMTHASSLLEKTQNLTSLYTQKLSALEDLKKSLLHQAFTGKLH